VLCVEQQLIMCQQAGRLHTMHGGLQHKPGSWATTSASQLSGFVTSRLLAGLLQGSVPESKAGPICSEHD
jgi:hypothetical protein